MDEGNQLLRSSTAAGMRFDRIEKLSGPANYLLWANTMEVYFDALTIMPVVNGTQKQPKADSKDDKEALTWQTFNAQARLALMQTVNPELIPYVVNNPTAAGAWAALKDKFFRDNTHTFFSQLKSLLDLRLENPSELSDHVAKFDAEWLRMLQRCANAPSDSKNPLPALLKPLMESQNAKAAFLLLSLPKSLDNVVDNLQTKTDLNYNDVYSRLVDLASTNSKEATADNKAYVVTTPAAPQQQKGNSNRENTKECSYCKAHKLGRYLGHDFNQCRKLAEDKANGTVKGAKGKGKGRANKAQEGNVAEVANLVTATSIVSPAP